MTHETTASPGDLPVVFLGLCERAAYVREGNTNLFKWNVLGLKTVFVSHVYPLKLEGLAIGFAFPTTIAAEEAKFRISNAEGNEVGTINLMAQAVNPKEDDFIAQKDQPFLPVPEYGWITAFLPLGATQWVVNEPGVYYLEQLKSDGAVRVGTLQFAAVDALPLSAERIAAIKSEPNAAKAVRLELGCKHCSAKFRVYAALEQSSRPEDESWIWYQNAPETFECDCGKTSMDLQYIRRNLHGLLGHQRPGDSEIQFMPLYERSSLQSIRTNFAQLIGREPREEKLQQFIDENPILLHQFPAEKIIPKPPILTSYVADFGIVTPQKELILIELEKTTTRLMKKGGDMAAPLSHAFDQVRNWLHEVDEHRLAVLDSLKIDRNAVSSVRGIVIAGRDVGYDARDLRRLKGVDYGRVAFLTYDDLVFALDALVRRVEKM